jgi:hypothetical protein
LYFLVSAFHSKGLKAYIGTDPRLDFIQTP